MLAGIDKREPRVLDLSLFKYPLTGSGSNLSARTKALLNGVV